MTIEKASYSQFPLSEFEVRLPCYWRQQKGTRKERLGNDWIYCMTAPAILVESIQLCKCRQTLAILTDLVIYSCICLLFWLTKRTRILSLKRTNIVLTALTFRWKVNIHDDHKLLISSLATRTEYQNTVWNVNTVFKKAM